MSGHSKWSSIKHKKGITDAKRSKEFSKIAKLLSIAARDGADPASNHRLQAVIDRARKANMPNDNIERAIKKAAEKDAASLHEVTIQAMGPEGVAIIVEAITDNTNRTISELKTILQKNNAKMASEGSLAYMFDKLKTNEGFEWVAKYPVEVADEAGKGKVIELLETLDDNDDVESVYSNLQI